MRTTPYVCVPSVGGTARHYAPLLERLGGGLALAPRAPTIAAMAAALDRDLDGIGQVVLIGHSGGATIASTWAAAHPERVAALVLLDPASDGRGIPPEAAAGMMAALRGDYRATIEAHWGAMLEASSPEVRALVMEDVLAAPPEHVTSFLEALLTFDPVTPLTRYAGPRVSITTPLNDVPEAVHALVPAIVQRRVDGTGHWLHLDAPDRVAALIRELIPRAG